MDVQIHLQGRLEDVHFPDLLLEISQRRETGILHLTRNQIEKDIYIQDGRIVFAKSNDPDERLGELLLRRGKVSLRHLVDSASRIGPGVRLGTILVQEGYLKAGELYQGVIDQVEEIIYSVFEWSDGSYQFHPGELPGKEVITLSISTPDIISIGISRIWRWSWIKKGVGPLDTSYVRRKEWNAIARKMLITPAVQSLIEMFEEPRKLEEVLSLSRINSYETCKLLWGLISIGLLEKIPQLQFQVEQETTPEASEAPSGGAAPGEPAAPAAVVPSSVPESLPTQAIPFTPRKMPAMPPPGAEPEPPAAPVPPEAARAEAATVEIAPSAPEAKLTEQESTPAPAAEMAPVEELTAEMKAAALPQAPLPEPGAQPTVEISFSDLAEFTDQIAPPAAQVLPPEVPREVIQKDVSAFNELHRYVFEMLRMEMGAGVGNFISKILKRAADRYPLIYEGIRINEFGELDGDTLLAGIQGNLVEDYRGAFDWLLKEERSTVSGFLDRKRLDALDTGIQKIRDKQQGVL